MLEPLLDKLANQEGNEDANKAVDANKDADGNPYPEVNPKPPAQNDDKRNPAQDKKLTPSDIEKLKNNGIDPHELKGGKSTGGRDLYKDRQGNIYEKPKGGQGSGNSTGVNINDLPIQR
ncbi:MAG: hypothetical protein HGB26_07605 [Desulfobulbaceae bacterium]|nr:hypothetical protein [Desulfobulbaceae bacterium]